MKAGIDLNEMVEKVFTTSKLKKDVVIPANKLQVSVLDDGSVLNSWSFGSTTGHAFKQITTDVGIPASYVKKLQQDKHYDLLESNVNTLLMTNDRKRMLRMVDGTLRGYLSNSYSTEYDNDVILKSVLPVLAEYGDKISIESCDVTDTKMYIKVTSDFLQADIQQDDPVRGGITIVNSEVGMSFYAEHEFIERLICANGMTRKDNISSFRKMHRGRALPLGSVRTDTVEAVQRAIALQIRDSIHNALNKERFILTVEQLRDTTKRKIEGNPVEAVKQLGKIVGYTNNEGDEILKFFIEGGTLTQYGLLNAVTSYAQDVDISYDRASELEAIGGKVLDLSPRQWKTVAEAA